MDLKPFLDTITSVWTGIADSGMPAKITGTGLLVLTVLVVFKFAEILIARLIKGRVADQTAMLFRKGTRYVGFVVAAMTLFNRLGIDISALLGAAGIAGIAIGFAAQTSVSNVISGLFLISEKSFTIGDGIQVGDVSGIVQAIDLLSVKIQTYDNRFIRVPNETIIKSNVVNVTRFPIRRFDLWMNVAYSSDLDRVKTVLLEVAADNVYVLDNPEPLIVFEKFDSSGISIMLGLWFEKNDFLTLKNSILIDVKKRFEAEGISIPFPQMEIRMEKRA